jgi:hypothetical membrane protein
MSGSTRGLAGLAARATAGVVGPVLFTAAWIIASPIQAGYPATQIQISGLAAVGARDPWIMIGGFLVLGLSLIAFGSALRQELGGARRAGPGPLLMQAAGFLTIVAELLRRDHVLLTSGPESWHNHAHNAVSAVLYVLLVVIPVVLAWRLRSEPGWRPMPALLVVATLISAVILVLFVSNAAKSWDGTLQRLGVTIPLAVLAAVAAVMALRCGREGQNRY